MQHRRCDRGWRLASFANEAVLHHHHLAEELTLFYSHSSSQLPCLTSSRATAACASVVQAPSVTRTMPRGSRGSARRSGAILSRARSHHKRNNTAPNRVPCSDYACLGRGPRSRSATRIALLSIAQHHHKALFGPEPRPSIHRSGACSHPEPQWPASNGCRPHSDCNRWNAGDCSPRRQRHSRTRGRSPLSRGSI
jgi:hypothetical protein